MGEFLLDSVPVTQDHQRLDQVSDGIGQDVPVADLSGIPDGGPGGLGGGGRIGEPHHP